MSSTPQHLVFNINTTTVLSDIDTFLTGVAGWVVDKYVTNVELYAHHTSTDGTIGYYSIKFIDDVPGYQGTLWVYSNLGFDTGQPVDNQPGVLKNTTLVASHKVVIDYGNKYCEAHMFANEDYMILTTAAQGAVVSTHDYVYAGILEKAFVYTGGNFIQGSNPDSTTPIMVWYDDGATSLWYTKDGGTFADAGGIASDINVIDYSSSAQSFDYINRTLNINPYEVFVAYDGGFAPIGYVRNLWFQYNSDNYYDTAPYSFSIVNSVINFYIPTSTIMGNRVVTVSPGV